MFKILKTSAISKARLGIIKTCHGNIQTPCFMPDATRGLIKNLTSQDLTKIDLSALVINTYHLYLRPGLKIIKKFGGIHNFMNWPGPLLSDSGGYQIYSLIHKNPKMGKITDNQVIFKSPYNGRANLLTAEKSISLQFDLGSDIIVCLDDCPPNENNYKKIKQAVDRTITWAKRSKLEYNKQIKKRKIINSQRPILIAVIQGADFFELRQFCATELFKIGFDGYGFGARPIDKQGKFLQDTLAQTAELIASDKIRFALGIGTPDDIIRSAKMGWDLFDCVIPTREGRHGKLFYFLPRFTLKSRGLTFKKFYYTININNSSYADDYSPINHQSEIKELCQYSKSFLHHLFKINDPLAGKLASLNNLDFYSKLMKNIRFLIKKNLY